MYLILSKLSNSSFDLCVILCFPNDNIPLKMSFFLLILGFAFVNIVSKESVGSFYVFEDNTGIFRYISNLVSPNLTMT